MSYDATSSTMWSAVDDNHVSRPDYADDVLDEAQSAIISGISKWGSKINMTSSRSGAFKFMFATLNGSNAFPINLSNACVCTCEVEVTDERGNTRTETHMIACVDWDHLSYNSYHITGATIYIDFELFHSLSDAKRANVIAHEIGHIYGLGHSTESDSIMQGFTQSISSISNHDGDGMLVMTHQAAHTDAEMTYTYATSVKHNVHCNTCNEDQTQEKHVCAVWEDYSSSNHKSTCSKCNHSVLQSHTYGGWTAYSATQHRALCTVCGHAKYGSHTLGDWTDYNATQHKAVCTVCGRTVYEDHSFGNWSNYSSTKHRAKCTECSRYKYANHTYGSWSSYSSSQHRRKCTACARYDYADHSFIYSGGMLVCQTCGYEKPY